MTYENHAAGQDCALVPATGAVRLPNSGETWRRPCKKMESTLKFTLLACQQRLATRAGAAGTLIFRRIECMEGA